MKYALDLAALGIEVRGNPSTLTVTDLLSTVLPSLPVPLLRQIQRWISRADGTKLPIVNIRMWFGMCDLLYIRPYQPSDSCNFVFSSPFI